MSQAKNLLKFFVYTKYLTQPQANDLAAKIPADSLPASSAVAEVLEKSGLFDEERFFASLAEYFRLPFSRMDMLEIDYSIADRFSYYLLKKHLFVPVSVDEKNRLLLAVSDPTDFYLTSAVPSFHDGGLKLVIAPPSQIKAVIDSVWAQKSTSEALSKMDADTTKKDAGKQRGEDSFDEVSNAPAVRLVDSIIKEAIPLRASDIHVEPFEKSVKVRYRIDGSLVERAEFLSEAYPAVCARLKILSGINIAERRLPQDGRIDMTIGGVDYDFRVSTLPTVYGEKFVVRILDKSSFSFTRKELGFTDADNKLVDKILSHPYGILLITGPTGCGKSTTLYSFLKELNRPELNIITVEDPVEYTLRGVNQTQVNPKANLTFASALRSILRQDPNVIMIGEIRDEETAQIAIRAAITGHLVFSTLHTNDAPGSLNRLIDMGVPSYLAGDAMVGVIAQRLVKRLCPNCKLPEQTTAAQTNMLKLDKPTTIFRPDGCTFCNNTGYKGRMAVHEIMYLDNNLRNAINDRESLNNLREIAVKNGMRTLWQACRDRVLSGETSLSELMSLAVE